MEPGRANVNLLTSLGFRPVICAAGLTATAVGTVYLFFRWPKETAEIGTQTDWEEAEASTQAGWETAQVPGVNGQLQPSGWDVQTLHRSTMVFTWSRLFPCCPGMVGMRRCSGETGKEEEESRLLVVMNGVQVIQTSMTYKRVTISADGSVRCLERSETTLAPVFVVPDPSVAGPTSTPGADASTAGDTQSSAQGSEDSSLMPEAREVPSLLRLGDFPTRQRALRQAFTILLRDQQQCNYVTVTLGLTLSNLATLNGRDVNLFQRAFDDLIAYVQNPENALSIQAELLVAGVHHINVLDIVFELVLFGIFEKAQPQLVPQVQGGFLEQLLAVVQGFLPSVAWSPAADQYQEMLRVDVAAFLEEVFSLELSDYSHLQTLADGLFSCLEHRVDQLLSRLPTP